MDQMLSFGGKIKCSVILPMYSISEDMNIFSYAKQRIVDLYKKNCRQKKIVIQDNISTSQVRSPPCERNTLLV